MPSQIEWENISEPLTERMIHGAELLLGVTFPADYREYLRLYHGASPLQSEYAVQRKSDTFGGYFASLLTIDPRKEENLIAFSACLPDGVIPFADDGGGDLLCFDYRGDPERKKPKVVYFSHEIGADDLFFVADSFSQLINSLRIPEDEE